MTVKELGYSLPASRLTFSLHRLTGRREKAIYKLLAENPQTSDSLPGQVRACLTVLLDTVGEVQYPNEAPGQPIQVEERKKLFDATKMPLGDIYYMYIMARMSSMGNDYKMTLMCQCKTENQYTLQLPDMEVDVAESKADLEGEIVLSEPVTIGDKEFTKAKVHGMVYQTQVQVLDDMAQAKHATISNCVSLVGYEFPLAVELVEDWPTSVINQLTQKVNELTPGISSILKFKCDTCPRITVFKADWEYQGFFA